MTDKARGKGKEFKNAKNMIYCGGFETRFYRPAQCPECVYKVGGGCRVGEYLVPFAGPTDTTCRHFAKLKGGE